jgi:hypothetical protein
VRKGGKWRGIKGVGSETTNKEKESNEMMTMKKM